MTRFIAIYSSLCRSLNILIPREDGKAFLSAPFGADHANQKYRDFCDKNIKIISYLGICDKDGYLMIPLKADWYEDKFDQGVKEIKLSLVEIFPQIKEFKEVSFDEFVTVTENNWRWIKKHHYKRRC